MSKLERELRRVLGPDTERSDQLTYYSEGWQPIEPVLIVGRTPFDFTLILLTPAVFLLACEYRWNQRSKRQNNPFPSVQAVKGQQLGLARLGE